MSRWNYLSSNSSTSKDEEYPDIDLLADYEPLGNTDKRLLKFQERLNKDNRKKI